MDNLLAISFEDQLVPFEALTALKELDEQGQIELVEGCIIERNAEGQLLIKDELKDRDRPGAKTARGGAIGLLVGIIGGPVGVLLGGIVGGLVGAAFDLSPRDEDQGPLARFALHVAPGQTAVLAHVDEPGAEIVDVAMSRLGGSVLREPLADVEAALHAEGTSDQT